ncbi:carboxypeptidase regulatory-like domain-containing protein [Fibrobacter sp.]|uniref:carboxypeptidase regulatory-like domain-containing protein n=1 Tax=Fibrobacter sp. TaxID=35828 RepID=UPI00386FB3E4
MKFAKSYLGVLSALCVCLFACTGENGGIAGTVTDTGNTVALGGVVTRTDGSRAVAAMVRMAREPVAGDTLAEPEYVETVTDSQGVFSFDSVLADTFQLAVVDAEHQEISYKPRATVTKTKKGAVLDSIKLEKAAVFSSVLLYENVSEPSVVVGDHFKVFMPGTPFSQSVFAGDSFSMLIPAGEWWFGFCPGDPQIVARLTDSGMADSLIYRTWSMDGKIKSGDTLSKGPFIWSPTMEVDSLIKLEERKAKKPYISGVVKCGSEKTCSNVQVGVITDLYGFDFVEGDSTSFVWQTVTDSSGRWVLPAPEKVPYDSLRMEYRLLSEEGKVVLAGVSRYVRASELKGLKDTLRLEESELLPPSVLVSGVKLAIDGADTDTTEIDNCMANSVVVGLKGTSHFVREMVCNMLKIENIPAGGHDIVLYSGDPKVVKTLQESGAEIDDYVRIAHIQLPKNDTLDQQWMTYEPPTLQFVK